MRGGERVRGWRAVALAVAPLAAATLLAAWAVSPAGGDADGDAAAPAEAGENGRGFVYAALGDSITRGTGARGHGAHPEVSWATGVDANVTSIAERLRAHPGVTRDVRAVNVAEDGARAADLPAQARLAVQARPDLVTVLVGANDACAQEAPDAAAFRADVRRAFTILREGAPEAAVVVVAFPDVARLVDVWGDDPGARGAWASFGACPAFVDGDGTAARVNTLNGVLEEEAARAGFTFTPAPVEEPFEREHVSTWDFFHPSVAGQARLADRAWPAVAGAVEAREA